MPTTSRRRAPELYLRPDTDEKDQLASSGSTRRRAVKLADVQMRAPSTARATMIRHWDVCVPPRACARSDTRIDPLFTMSDNRVPRLRRAAQSQNANLVHADKQIHPAWWSQTGSNRRPPACKAGALPAELWPRARGIGGPGSTRTIDLTLIRGAL
jgi:hypothetical protein